MSISDVQAALLGAAATGLGSITCAHENAPFEPTANTKWAAAFFLPNQPSVETLGDTGRDIVDGILQVDINYPIGSGNSAVRSDFETFRAQFAAGSVKTSSSQVVRIINCGRSQGRIVEQWYRVSFTVSWYASIPR